MRRVQNLTDEPIQIHTLLFEEQEITLTLRYFPRAEFWAIDVEFNDSVVRGLKLSAGVLHMESRNQPFDFVVTDRSGSGIDPFRRDDFAVDRCRLYLLESDDMERIRGGAEVPI